MQDPNIPFCRLLLKETRKDAKKAGIILPAGMRAFKVSGMRNWWVVSGNGFRSVEIKAANAYDAKTKIIEQFIEAHEKSKSS